MDKSELKKKTKIPVVVYLIVVILIVIAGILNIVLSTPDEFERNKDIAIENCIKECQIEQGKGTTLTDGPCLSNNIATGWICDVAHDPRVDIIDNNPDNQCSEYRKGNNKHFVEITETCELIKAK